MQTALFPNLAGVGEPFYVQVGYRTGDDRMALGGDFYDVCLRPDGRLGVVIGDVTGHDPEAAACGAALRAAWRSLTLQGMELADIPAALDAMLASERPTDRGMSQLATVCLAIIDPDGTTSLTSAGHPFPLLLTPSGAYPVDLQPGMLLGTGHPLDPTVSTFVLGRSHTLFFYTDGLIESGGLHEGRAPLGPVGLQQLLDAMGPHLHPDAVIHAALDVSDQHLADDAAVVTVRLQRRQ